MTMTRAATKKSAPKIQLLAGPLCLLGHLQPLPALCPDFGARPWEPGSPEGGEEFSARPEPRTDFQTRSGPAAPTPSPSLLVTESLRGKANAAGEVATVPYEEANRWHSQQPSPAVWKTNDFCCRQMGVSSYSRPMRLQLRKSRGISSSRRGKKQLAPEPMQSLLLKVTWGHRLKGAR